MEQQSYGHVTAIGGRYKCREIHLNAATASAKLSATIVGWALSQTIGSSTFYKFYKFYSLVQVQYLKIIANFQISDAAVQVDDVDHAQVYSTLFNYYNIKCLEKRKDNKGQPSPKPGANAHFC